jgi:hypothetical protein
LIRFPSTAGIELADVPERVFKQCSDVLVAQRIVPAAAAALDAQDGVIAQHTQLM